MAKNKMLLPLIIIAAVGLGIITGYFWLMGTLYVSTDDAQTSGNIIAVVPQVTGTISAVTTQVGTKVVAGQVIARETIYGTPASQVAIVAPVGGLVVTVPASPGTATMPGSPVVTIWNPKSAWITANIPETDINRLHPGQMVSIHVDAYPNLTYQGVVSAIQPASLAAFSLFPPDASTNFTKVTQLVPVNINFIPGQAISGLYPGLSAEVTVDLQGGGGFSFAR